MDVYIDELFKEKDLKAILIKMANDTLIKEDSNKKNIKEYLEIFKTTNSQLKNIIKAIKRKHDSSKEIFELFKQNSFFDNWTNDKYNILKIAIEAFWKNDYLVFAHLISPVIEGFISKIVKMNDDSGYKPNNKGGLNDADLWSNLENKNFNFLFETSSEIFCFHLGFILARNEALNLRNRLTHGRNFRLFYSEDPSNWFFQILCLFLMKDFFKLNNK